ncbi:MAG: putative acyl esterase [Alphaproteobacteria bacterium]
MEETPVVEIRAVMIPMPDGLRLATDLYMPANIELSDKVPVLLEYTPYRKMESRGSRYKTYSYFVKRDYIVARVDARGTGNSEGQVIP